MTPNFGIASFHTDGNRVIKFMQQNNEDNSIIIEEKIVCEGGNAVRKKQITQYHAGTLYFTAT